MALAKIIGLNRIVNWLPTRTLVGRGDWRIASWAGLFLLVLPVFSAGAAPGIEATVDRQTIGVGESVALRITCEELTLPGTPNLPALTNLTFSAVAEELGRFSVNGQITVRQTFNYTLIATRAGDTTIPSMSIQAGGRVFTTKPIQLRILQAPAQPAAPEIAFLRLLVPKTEVYLGEVFAVEVQLYVQNGEGLQMPQVNADGFSISPLQKTAQSRVQSGGAVYNLLAFKAAATAAKVGAFDLGPAECSLVLHIPGDPRQRDIFGRIPYTPRATTLRSAPQPMRVLPLPVEGRPENFKGAVGNFALTVTASPTNPAVGDPITVKVQISGSGPLESLTLPPQPQWREFKTYPPQTAFDSTDPLGLSGTRSFTLPVSPENHEVKALPGFTFPFFSPERRAYQVLRSRDIPLAVRASASSVPSLLLTNTGSGQPAPAADIFHIRPRMEMTAAAPAPWLGRPWFLAVPLTPVLAWLALLVRRKRQEALARNPRLRRQRQVAQYVRDGLKELHTLAAANQGEEFFAALFRLLQEQLGERLDLPASAITEAVIDQQLVRRGVLAETRDALHALFQTCNLARYAPVKSGQELAALIPKLENVLSGLQNIKE